MPSVPTVLADGIFTVANLFSPQECAELIARSETLGYDAASIATGAGAVMLPQIRNNDRVDVLDEALRSWWWERVRPLLSPELDGYPLVGLHERLRFYRYDPGQRFKLHTDGRVRGEGDAVSRLTCLAYLNEDFEGGATIFHLFDAEEGKRRREIVVRPQTGMALVFVHERWHEGEELRSGRKYVLRADVLYAGVPKDE